MLSGKNFYMRGVGTKITVSLHDHVASTEVSRWEHTQPNYSQLGHYPIHKPGLSIVERPANMVRVDG